MGPVENFLVIVVAAVTPWVAATIYRKVAQRRAERRA